MESRSLTALGREQLTAKASSNGRSAHTAFDDHEDSLRQNPVPGPPGSVTITR